MYKTILKYFRLALFLVIFILFSCSTKNQKIVKSDNTINVNIGKKYIISKGNYSENIGDDPIKASTYGLKNLKIVANKFMDWIHEPNKDYSDLNEIYDELLGVYSRYIFHVIGIVGGINQTLHNTNQDEIFTYVNVDKAYQMEALKITLIIALLFYSHQFFTLLMKMTDLIL